MDRNIKQQLEKIFYENENTYQEELVEEYNPDNIFKKKKTENATKTSLFIILII